MNQCLHFIEWQFMNIDTLKLKPDDQIILSAKAIPGNEGSVSGIINHLLKAGAKVAYQRLPDIHVSGPLRKKSKN